MNLREIIRSDILFRCKRQRRSADNLLSFGDLYRAQSAEFPPECKGGDYEKRIQAAYPIHPEIFERLYSDWSTLAWIPTVSERANKSLTRQR